LPPATEAIKHANSAAQWPLTEAILSLQTDPRPAGSEKADDYVPGYTAILVKTVPPHQVIYLVDDDNKRITVVAVVEARWKR
jgi:hypothetical protein